ncbi:uncharacterized protein LOC124693891 isoform X2 [Lolium rigidum]|uniref:uncharacterized protein LOC124693891 isoform X2 n=1 Tax=Lolium rigidum TaxID=89674 RepID=UPI001F5CB75A|nr:uncharacterized protein LOC124693891 isoform X2 [Lolium rigidum]
MEMAAAVAAGCGVVSSRGWRRPHGFIHTAIIVYNYYHRKMFPQLDFADAKRFCVCACISAGEGLLAYLTMVHACEDNSGKEERLSATDIAAVQACEIAAKLDASKASPDMAMWPISKFAVLLLDSTRKKCLIEFGAITKGVCSIIENEFDATAGISHTTSQPAGQESTKKINFGTLNGLYLLQQLALSEVECRTGIKSSELRILDEAFAYSLSKERTTTKLFIMEYKKIMNTKFVEISLQELISSMTGPVFVTDPFPKTTSVVEYYHILPYKEILFELLHRNWPADCSVHEQSLQHGLHSMRDEILEEHDADSTFEMQKQITEVSTRKQNKQAIEANGANSNQSSSTIKQRKNNKRKFEASRATAAEGPDDATAAASAGRTALEPGVQVDNKKTQKSTCSNMPQDGFPTEAPYVDPVMKNGALKPQNVEVMEKSGGVTENNDDQVYDLLRSILKIRDEICHTGCIIQERCAQCDMDIQIILNERKMTPKVLSIRDKYKEPCTNMLEVVNSSCTGNCMQTMSMERKTLGEALDEYNACQELNKMCNRSNWIHPGYIIVPSAAEGKFCATVHLEGHDFEISTTGDPCMTPSEAKRSAALNMIIELHRKREKERQAELLS